jgi:hypothetical protein
MVVLNLIDLERITARYDEIRPVMVEPPENREFLQALLHGDLGYREVASFHTTWPLIPDDLIRSLSPHFVVLARNAS